MNSKLSAKKSQSKAPEEKQQDNQNELFPVVGIGASAGGLEAFIELLSHLPTDTGMAFVIVQHMSPNQESFLSVILARSTQMPVSEVRTGMAVAPNHVYVISPNVSMIIAQGLLKLKPRGTARGQFMTVDTFLLSLAEERGSKAIAVILSGSDGDGTRGVEAIKAAGGVTFAQSQDTAKVDSMPNTAIATGQVDFILPPEKIAEKIAEISRHPYIVDNLPTKKSAASENALAMIYSLLRSGTGVDFTNYKQTTLKRRIQRRMVLYELERLEDYALYLQNTPTEVTALYHDALINVTSFFRDPESFEALKSQVFPIITNDKSLESPLRIWVAGCSTGEEAYSIGICLLEFLAAQVTHLHIQIYATDISETVIEYARRGFYTPSQVANVTSKRLQRFFVQVEGGYQISKPVRELCIFAQQNLISDPPFSQMDLITCRNVLIYLDNSLQRKLLPVFHYGLKPTGFLMLGISETVADFSDLFTLVDKKSKLYAKKLGANQLNLDLFSSSFASNYPLAIIKPQPPVTETLNDLEMQKEADRIVLQQYAPVGVVINTDLEILQFRGQTSAYLEPSPGKASLNLLKMAKAGLRLELQTAIYQAKRQNLPKSRVGLEIKEGDRFRQVSVNVIPFQSATENYFLVLFEETPLISVIPAADDGSVTSLVQTNNHQEIERLQQELNTTKEHLQAIIEEHQAANQDLRAANEEILSSNEELQSMNEELETAKEEIQATNEELNTINEELHRRNVELNQVSNDLQNLLSSINIPILMLEDDLRIRKFTPAVEDIFNLISSDVGRPLSDITHKLNVPELEQEILEVIRTLNLKVREIQDLEGHWYDMWIRPYRTIDNKIDGAVVVLVDIDELKRSAERFTQARDYAEAIVETVREPLLVLNLDLRVITANHSFYETFQVAPTQTEQRLIFELGNGQWDMPQLRSLLAEIIDRTDQFQDFEVEQEFDQIGQKTMLLNARKMPLVDDTQMILLAIEDITEQKRLIHQEQLARAAAESANRAKDEFLSTLSHELRQPLTAMIGWAKLLRTKKINAAQIEQGLETIERNAKMQAQLIEDILDLARIGKGKFRLDIHEIELAPVIKDAIEIVRLAAEAKNIQLESRLSPSTLKVLADPIRLQQVISNLLSNAVKFTPTEGIIEITLDYIDAQAQIQISDTGKGIHADFLPDIFERFRQQDGSYSRSNPGLGLGLSIVRDLVELHGGTVNAESLGEGQGATFTVRLPLPTDPEASSRLSALEPVDSVDKPEVPIGDIPSDIPSLQGVRVLVVDDEADIRELLTTILEQCDVEVTTAASASEALLMLTASPERYDVLLSDIGMPEQDGYALIRQVRALSPDAGGLIPAAAMTAYAREQDRQNAIASGFQIHVAKPIESAQLARVVADLAGRADRSSS